MSKLSQEKLIEPFWLNNLCVVYHPFCALNLFAPLYNYFAANNTMLQQEVEWPRIQDTLMTTNNNSHALKLRHNSCIRPSLN